MKGVTKAALYMRLSKDDEQFGDSISIETQRYLFRGHGRGTEHFGAAIENQITIWWWAAFYGPPLFHLRGGFENGNNTTDALTQRQRPDCGGGPGPGDRLCGESRENKRRRFGHSLSMQSVYR